MSHGFSIEDRVYTPCNHLFMLLGLEKALQFFLKQLCLWTKPIINGCSDFRLITSHLENIGQLQVLAALVLHTQLFQLTMTTIHERSSLQSVGLVTKLDVKNQTHFFAFE